MKLKENLKNIFKNDNHDKYSKKRLITIIIIGLILIISASSFVFIKNKKSDIDDLIRAEENKLFRVEQDELKKSKERYLKLCSEYNESVESYNNTIAKFNLFLDKVKDLDILNNTNHLPYTEKAEENFSKFQNEGADFSKLSDKIELIRFNSSVIDSKYEEIINDIFNSVVNEYNIVADEYQNAISNSSVDFIEGLIKIVYAKENKLIVVNENFDEDEIIKEIKKIKETTNKLAESYVIVDQITCPKDSWIKERFKNVESILNYSSVTLNNDPNGLLGKEGGYNGCVYFGLKEIDQNTVPGIDIISKGTDAGGSVEIYNDLESAKNRCEYLSQFDDTLLYSGSYVIVGTMVIRTSYKLSNEDQIRISNDIITELTKYD